MNWSDLAPLVSSSAPTLGRLLGGSLPIPFGGSVGEAVGQAVAAAIGTAANPDTVAATLAATPDDVKRAQLAAAESEAAEKWKAFAAEAAAEAQVATATVKSVSDTIQAELVGGSLLQKSWRPLAMYVWVLSWPVQLGTILYQVGSKDPATIGQLTGMVGALTAWNAGPAALAGVYSWGRTREKIAASDNGQ